MLVRFNGICVLTNVLLFLCSIRRVLSEASSAFTVRFPCEGETCSRSTHRHRGYRNRTDVSFPDSSPQLAMLQKSFKTANGQGSLASSAQADDDGEREKNPGGKGKLFRWGVSEAKDHPRSIGKWRPHAAIQDYEAAVPHLTGLVLNIFGKVSNGDGGLLLALEVPSPCSSSDEWIEVDRSRCSSRYPCALRVPGGAVKGTEAQPTKFRTRVIAEDEDYLTDFLEYERVTLDRDAEATLAHEHFSNADESTTLANLKFKLSPVMSSGALMVTPVVKGATADTLVTMKLRQPDKDGKKIMTQVNLAQIGSSLQDLDDALQSYKKEWAGTWRESSEAIGGCDHSHFEVVADQVFPGDVELEVLVSGDGGKASLSDVLVTTRVSWAEAEVALMDTMLKDHYAFFNDPEEMIHGLPMDALKRENPRQLTDSNPCEWGYAMESWLIMVETGSLAAEDAVAKLSETFSTLDTLQNDPEQFAHGLFYPYYRLRSKETGGKLFPKNTGYDELPCGDDALLYASMMLVQGWLKGKNFDTEAEKCGKILGRMDFSKCVRKTDCAGAGNGLEDGSSADEGDKFWSVPLTINAKTMKQNPYNWNVWADEGGLVAMIVALNGAVSDEQYESIVRQQQRYSPCTNWEGITVGHSAFFNSIFTLPTRSMLGFGTLFASPYLHEFAVRSVLPSFRAHQKLKRKLKVDYIGPSDAMSMMPKAHPGRFYGSYAYWPPNNMYDCRKGKTTKENQCTWCKGIQYEGLDDQFDTIVPHGNMASFLVSAMMERSQFSAWIEDTKRLMSDWSEVYTPGYGLEVVGPAKRTARGATYDGAFDGRGIFEALSHGYTVLSIYEGMATMRRRYELAKKELNVPGHYEPPSYRPLSDFLDAMPKVRSKINKLLAAARAEESQEKHCQPSSFGPPGHY